MTFEEIITAVEKHHKLVEAFGYTVVFTALIGSQNYGLDDDQSDIDTFSLILPSFDDIALAKDPVSSEFEVEDGKCMYKDIRLALNLLKKASPNSTEMFASYYNYYNPEYKDLVLKYLDNGWNNGWNQQHMIHCNYYHMLTACAGMSHQLTKRNMPAGKRYSHAVRMQHLVKHYTESLDLDYLFILPPDVQTACKKAKRDTDNEEFYNTECQRISKEMDMLRDNFKLDERKQNIEKHGIKLIEDFQTDLLKQYLKGAVK